MFSFFLFKIICKQIYHQNIPEQPILSAKKPSKQLIVTSVYPRCFSPLFLMTHKTSTLSVFSGATLTVTMLYFMVNPLINQKSREYFQGVENISDWVQWRFPGNLRHNSETSSGSHDKFYWCFFGEPSDEFHDTDLTIKSQHSIW